MARGRMISKSLSTSEKRAQLHHVAPKLAEFCQALYPLLIAHADDWGCLQGDVFTVKHLVDPTSPRKLKDFDAALMALHNVGLITWYAGGPDDDPESKWFIYIRGWFCHQQLKGHDADGRKRNFPAPPENPSNFTVSAQIRPTAPKSALTKEKRTEENLTEPTAGEEPPASEVGAFIKAFCEDYKRHRHGATYHVERRKHVPLVKALLKDYGLARLIMLAQVLLLTDDDWIANTDRGIGILSVKASWLDQRLAEAEASQKGAA